jgi:hypothetical protein
MSKEDGNIIRSLAAVAPEIREALARIVDADDAPQNGKTLANDLALDVKSKTAATPLSEDQQFSASRVGHMVGVDVRNHFEDFQKNAAMKQDLAKVLGMSTEKVDKLLEKSNSRSETARIDAYFELQDAAQKTIDSAIKPLGTPGKGSGWQR